MTTMTFTPGTNRRPHRPRSTDPADHQRGPSSSSTRFSRSWSSRPQARWGFFESIGLPGFLAYLVIAAELFGGLALILGFKTRLVSLALVPILLGAIFTAHWSAGFIFSNQGGGWEYPAFWAVALIVQALIGSGLYALDSRE